MLKDTPVNGSDESQYIYTPRSQGSTNSQTLKNFSQENGTCRISFSLRNLWKNNTLVRKVTFGPLVL